MGVNLESPSYSPLVNITLSFSVRFGPPTNTNCTANGSGIPVQVTILEYQYETTSQDTTKVSLHIIDAKPGLYKCAVSNKKSNKSETSINLQGLFRC